MILLSQRQGSLRKAQSILSEMRGALLPIDALVMMAQPWIRAEAKHLTSDVAHMFAVYDRHSGSIGEEEQIRSP